MPRNVWTGIIMLENPNIMLLQIRYNNRLDNSVTSVECQCRDGTLSIEAACSLLLTVLLQALVPVAFLSKQPNFLLERNLLHQDEVMRKWSSCDVVLRGLPDLCQSATLPVCCNLFSCQLIVSSWHWKSQATSLADMPAVIIIPMALSHITQTSSNLIPGQRPIIDFQRFFFSFCAYNKKALELCAV